jgi:hypothetical protein
MGILGSIYAVSRPVAFSLDHIMSYKSESTYILDIHEVSARDSALFFRRLVDHINRFLLFFILKSVGRAENVELLNTRPVNI